MTPYTPGTRVVCVDDPPFIGTVDEVYSNGDLLIFSGPTATRVDAASVRPAMPRDRHDVDRDRWWWRNGRPVWVTWTTSGVVWSTTPGWPDGLLVSSVDDWRGPVAPPPEVRHG